MFVPAAGASPRGKPAGTSLWPHAAGGSALLPLILDRGTSFICAFAERARRSAPHGAQFTVESTRVHAIALIAPVAQCPAEHHAEVSAPA
eukprot:11638537-Heterocapsa_arctica.AAC.1